MFWKYVDEETWNTGILTGGCVLLGIVLGAAIDGAAITPGAVSAYSNGRL
jgi:hypothetical protein